MIRPSFFAIRLVVPALFLASCTLAPNATQIKEPAAPPRIDIARAPAPQFDDPVWHGASDPYVIWNPKAHLWFMYYTQRRASLNPVNGVDWVHGCAIGIATSPDGTHWKYAGICQGGEGAYDLDHPLEAKISWWAPCYVLEGGTFHMFVTRVDGIYTRWMGRRTIEHFTSDDGIHWKHLNTAQTSSINNIDPMVVKIDDTWYLWYKDETRGSHTWLSTSPDMVNWTVQKEVIGDIGAEAPFVWQWKGAWWLILDAGNRGLRIYRSDTGKDNWQFNSYVLNGRDGKRTLDDNATGHHPAIITQGDQCLIYYFTQHGRPSVIQIAELTLDENGKVQCDRNKYLATTPAAPAAPATQP